MIEQQERERHLPWEIHDESPLSEVVDYRCLWRRLKKVDADEAHWTEYIDEEDGTQILSVSLLDDDDEETEAGRVIQEAIQIVDEKGVLDSTAYMDEQYGYSLRSLLNKAQGANVNVLNPHGTMMRLAEAGHMFYETEPCHFELALSDEDFRDFMGVN